MFKTLGVCLVSAAIGCAPLLSRAGEDEKAQAAIRKAVAFLKVSQGDNGTWTTNASPGVTALVTAALLQNGVDREDPAVKKALTYLESLVKPDGGIYAPDTSHKNYETSIALLAIQAANTDGKYSKIVENAAKFLKGIQWDEDEQVQPADNKFGGAGYGRSKRPDLSNTSFFLDALKSAGVREDDPAMQNALKFVSRCQNLETEHNTTEFSAKVNDGGFYYTPADGGASMAGKTPEGGLRSYASMTYAGLKSMIYAGLTPQDPRVKAALAWIQKHYSLSENPGMDQAGLFYYYHTFAKALSVLKVEEVEDAQGKKHFWRKELIDKLISLQKDNGSWVNPEPRWMEGDPNMATAYSLLALSLCLEK